jgi:hypothetical protein
MMIRPVVLAVLLFCSGPPTARAQDVKVTDLDGSQQKGVLVSLTDSAVVIRHRPLRSGRESTIPLAQVQKVETYSDTGKVIGLTAGAIGGFFLGGWIYPCNHDDCSQAEVDQQRWTRASIGAAVTGGIGFLIGEMLDARRRAVLFQSPGRSTIVTPLVGPGVGGAALTMRW